MGIFGINNEAIEVLTNYLLRERDLKHFKKGAKVTLSFVYHYLLNMVKIYRKGITKKIVIYFDNCVGKNKNNKTI